MARRPTRAPYEGARVEELEEPLLPRWFVLLALALVPTAIGVLIWAFVAFGPTEVPVEARRPPPEAGSGLTTAVGDRTVGDLDPVEVDPACPVVSGIRAGGTAIDRARIAFAVDGLCSVNLPGDVGRRIQAFGQAGGVIRFAAFEATGVDSTLNTAADVPTVLINSRLARDNTDALWIAPLVVHDVTYLLEPVGVAASELLARQAESEICARLFAETRPSRACDDADALLALPDPLEALREAGFG